MKTLADKKTQAVSEYQPSRMEQHASLYHYLNNASHCHGVCELREVIGSVVVLGETWVLWQACGAYCAGALTYLCVCINLRQFGVPN